MSLEIGDFVICIVDRIVGTIVFVKIEGEEREGSLILSEVAPGRIRNLRDYVVPKKMIVCKVLRVSNDRIDLSLRRVSPKEKKEVLERFSQEKAYKSLFEKILGKDAESAINKIPKEKTLGEFLEESKQNSKKLEELIGKESSEKILKIINVQKKKNFSVKKEFHLVSYAPNGLEITKKILEKLNDVEILYLSGGNYSIKANSEEIKKADLKIKEILEQIEKEAKNLGAEFFIKEK